MPELQILAAAAEEAEAAIRWYEYEQPELGKQLRARFDAALDQLEAGTLAGSSMPGPIGIQGVRRLVLRRFPYSIVFIPPRLHHHDFSVRAPLPAPELLAVARAASLTGVYPASPFPGTANLFSAPPASGSDLVIGRS